MQLSQAAQAWLESRSTAPFGSLVAAAIADRNAWPESTQLDFPEDYLPTLRTLFDALWPTDQDPEVAKCLAILLQVMANAAVGSESRQASIWAQLFPAHILALLGRPALKTFCMCCAVIHQCTVDSAERCTDLVTDPGILVVAEIVGRLHVAEPYTHHTGLEWAVFIVESLVKRGHAGAIFYALCELPKGSALGIAWLHTLSDELVNSEHCDCNVEYFLPLVDRFIQFVEKAVDDSKYWTGREDAVPSQRTWGAAWLRLWCGVTAQNDGTSERNMFALRLSLPCTRMLVRARKEWPVQKPRHGQENADPERAFEAHALADWVRLVGNLAYRCHEAQDIVRENEGLAALLSCCQLDHRNPIIKEWAILAVRHMCEGNAANQDIVRVLEQRAVVKDDELGMELSIDDATGRIRMKRPEEL